MLKGHDTLTRLIGKRRKLSLSALSANKTVLSEAKKEVQEDFLSVTTSANPKNHPVEIPCSSKYSVDQQKDGDTDILADCASTSLRKVEQIVVKSETGVKAECSQTQYAATGVGCGDHAVRNNHGFATQLRRKTKQATLSRFYSSGVHKLPVVCSSRQGERLIEEEKNTSCVTVKTEDNVPEQPFKLPVSCHRTVRGGKIKTDIKQEIDPDDTCHGAWLDILRNDVLHGSTATSTMRTGSGTTSSKSPQQLRLVPDEAKSGNCSIIPLDHVTEHVENVPFDKSAEPVCVCLCHRPTCSIEDLNSNQVKVEIEAYIDEVGRGRDPAVVVKDEATPTPVHAESVDQSTSSLPNEISKSLLLGVLETRIVGRRYHRGVSCEEGMKVTVLREPENPVDPNAIKIVPLESPLGPALGHLPKEISAHLSLLLDKGFVQVQGIVISIPEQINGNIPLKLSFESSNGSTDLSVHDGAAESWQSMILAAESRSSSINVRVSKYQRNFIAVLQTVLERDSHLFTVQEKDFLGTFCSLSGDAQRLLIRLYQRKGPWFRLSSLSYKDITDVSNASEELLVSGFMTTACSVKQAYKVSLRARIECLTMPELKQLALLLKKKSEAATARREELITLLVSTASEKNLNGEESSNSRPTILDMVAEIAGSCIRLSDQAEFLLWRVERLFFLDRERDLSSFLVVDMGLVKYPRYKCLKSRHVFPTHEGLVAYEQALEIAQGMDMSLEISDVEGALNFLERARDELNCCEVGQSAADPIPPFLARFSAAYVYKNVITVGVSILERERRYKEAVEALKQLLGRKELSGRWGYWTLRLSINLDHLGCKEESLKAAEAGVNEPWIRGGDRVALQRRVVRLGKPPRRWKKPPYADALNRKCKEVQILGRPLNCVAGKKSRFYGYDGEQCGVEELALQYYASEEGGTWQGVHSEGGVWLTLFGLLMWDVLFADVPDVFQTAFQTAPLDLNTELFYPSRQDMIEGRLAAIAGGRAGSIITQTWNANFGTMCSGVNWERHSLAELLVIAKCIGGPELSHVCRLLAEDHAGWRGGMPDLLLWRTTNVDASSDSSVCTDCGCSSLGRGLPVYGAVESISSNESCSRAQRTEQQVLSTRRTIVKGEAKLVEVKGPRDRLSEQQMAWIWTLMNGGLSVEWMLRFTTGKYPIDWYRDSVPSWCR